MEQLDFKDIKIQELEEEIKRLKEIIKWQSLSMAGNKQPKLTLKKK